MNIKNIKSCYGKLPSEIFCLSLGINIKVTGSAYKHVFKQKIRSKEEIENRAESIKYIKELLEVSSLYQDHSKKIHAVGATEYWNVQGIIKGVSMHVTLRKIGNQPIHLFSWHYQGKRPQIN